MQFAVSQAAVKELEKAQNDQSEALMALLDWISTQQGKLGAKDGKFLFSTEVQRAEMLTYLARIEAADKAAEKAASAVQLQTALQAQGRERAKQIAN
ncbi:hypothetical protein [Noviherbaspirillum galbum]|uniref:Uncharacterized protein n=1 Tax=Noviherbaspirillum galbum TaxID=2709383 RepID=A0A6B3SRF9_9BURK|nr:hypothetical protein [Noviherbaspirillum galbum]NEX63357.1 hypothetical protein [Noviherbaspirillum galbum]